MVPSSTTSIGDQHETEEADYQSGLLQNCSRWLLIPPSDSLDVIQNLVCFFLLPSVGGFGSILMMNWREREGKSDSLNGTNLTKRDARCEDASWQKHIK